MIVLTFANMQAQMSERGIFLYAYVDFLDRESNLCYALLDIDLSKVIKMRVVFLLRGNAYKMSIHDKYDRCPACGRNILLE